MIKYIKIYLIAFGLLLAFTACDKSRDSNRYSGSETKGVMLPKALYITSGSNEGNGNIAQGITVAIQSMNPLGVPVRLETRDILLDEKALSEFNILILSSSIGYHDADRKYSLTYLSDHELEHLNKFVQNGGILIAGDNIGRNYRDGTDRITVFGELTAENWPLAECFGVDLTERNMKGYGINGAISGCMESVNLPEFEKNKWTLVPSAVQSDNISTLAWWKNANDSIPAIIQNKFGEGYSYLLASSYFLHPANDGGLWSAAQIGAFYGFVIEDYLQSQQIDFKLNPWPEDFQYAFCVGLNAEGTEAEFKRINKELKNQKIEPVYFVNGDIPEDIQKLIKQKELLLASNSYGVVDYSELNYTNAKFNILMNENEWDTKFDGWRFPYTRSSFWGLFALSELNYAYESSIGADNISFFHGSVVPYNIPVSQSGYYSCTDVLEISPTYHDDYHFLGKLANNKNYPEDQMSNDIRLYEQYLLNFWEYGVKPYNGQMSFLGHPAYSAYNDSTLFPLKMLSNKVKQENAWISTLPKISKFRSGLSSLQFFVEQNGRNIIVRIKAPVHIDLHKVSLQLKNKPVDFVASQGDISIKESNAVWFLTFNAFDGQEIIFKY